MTEEQALQVRELRSQGTGYKTIAGLVGISRDSVRYYCQRHGLGGIRIVYEANLKDRISDGLACAYCGGPLKREHTGRPRKFCSEACRRRYWKIHRNQLGVSDKKVYAMECPYCHKIFEAYGSRRKKFCCHEHYVLYRFGHDKRVEALSEKSDGAFLMEGI